MSSIGNVTSNPHRGPERGQRHASGVVLAAMDRPQPPERSAKDDKAEDSERQVIGQPRVGTVLARAAGP